MPGLSLPTTGILGGSLGLPTDGILGAGVGASLMVVDSIDIDTVPDDGGVIITASGIFPLDEPITVNVTDGGDLDEPTYSGVVGQKFTCYSTDGVTLSFVVTTLPIGGPYDLVFSCPLCTVVLAAALTVIHRSFTTRHFSLRRSTARPRDVGAYAIQDEQGAGQLVGFWEGLFSAIADELYDHAGYLIVRTTASALAGNTSLTVEGTDRYPEAGRLAVGGQTVRYASKTNTTFDGITQEDGTPGLPIDVRLNSVVMDFSQANTQIDDLRSGFYLATAEGTDLDIIARNYGLVRPRGVDDDTWRELLYVIIAVEAQTIYACEQILDVLAGPGNYEVYEDLIDNPHKVFVRLLTGATVTTQFEGKTWLVSGEPQPSTGAFTVDVDNPVAVPYGVYADTDPYRNNNFGLDLIAAGSTNAGNPTRYTKLGEFTLADEGRPFFCFSRPWVVWDVLSSDVVELARLPQSDGIIDPLEPDVFETELEWFSPLDVGITQIVIPSGPEAGSYPIIEWLSARRVRLGGAAFTNSLINVDWQVFGYFPTLAGLVAASILRISAVGNTITTPNGPLPANVLVDYTHVPSAQLVIDELQSGNDQYPFYLWDESFIAQWFLDLITAAGVEVVVELE